VSTAYTAFRLVQAPVGPIPSGQDIREKSDYALMLLQCALGMIIMLLPGILERKAKLTIPSGMIIAYAAFLYCAIYLGEVHSFYFRIPHWDTMLHGFSGGALGAVGISMIGLLNKSKSTSIPLSPGFVALFAFCFAVAAGTVWEIYEFAVDTIADLNMQKYALESGEALIGRAALVDTMKDLIVDTLGALVISVFSYVSMRRKDSWQERMQLKFNRPTPVPVPVYSIQIPLAPPIQPAMAAAEASSMPENLHVAV